LSVYGNKESVDEDLVEVTSSYRLFADLTEHPLRTFVSSWKLSDYQRTSM
jgi:hypothetical protein